MIGSGPTPADSVQSLVEKICRDLSSRGCASPLPGQWDVADETRRGSTIVSRYPGHREGVGGSASSMQAFSSMLVHLPLVPA